MSSLTYIRKVSSSTAVAFRQASRAASSSSGKVSLLSSPSSCLLAASHTFPNSSSVITHTSITGNSLLNRVFAIQTRNKSYFKTQKGGSRRGSHPPRSPKSPQQLSSINSRVTRVPENDSGELLCTSLFLYRHIVNIDMFRCHVQALGPFFNVPYA
jgi:hypothetical protein